MADVNKIILIGRLGQDPELKELNGGTSLAKFSIATSYGKDKKTTWHNVTVFGKQVGPVVDYLSKGSRVYLEGRLESRKYEAKDGTNRTAWEIIANDVKFLDTKKDSPQASTPVQDDIPF